MRRSLAFTLLLLCGTAHGKVEQGTFVLTSAECEHFISKFSFDPGDDARVTMQLGGHGSSYAHDGRRHDLLVAIYNDDAWQKYTALRKGGSLCADRMKVATRRVELTNFQPSSEDDKRFEVGLDESFKLSERSHYFFFVLSDCSLEFYDAAPPALDYKLHVLNSGSELPAHERGLAWAHGVAALGLWAALAGSGKGLAAQHRRFGQVHASALVAAVALALQALASSLECLHLVVYCADGRGLRWRHGRLPLDLGSDVCACVSEALVMVLVVAVGCGWTLLDGAARRLAPVWAAAAAVVPLQVGLELVSRRYEDDFSTFHDFDHWPGAAHVALRLLAAGLLLARGAWRRRSQGGGGDALGGSSEAGAGSRALMARFAALGAAWLLSFPVVVLGVAPRLPLTRRHLAVTAATLLCQGSALASMLTLFLGVGTAGQAYVRASTLGGMGDLSAIVHSNGASSADRSSAAAAVATVLRRKVNVD